MGFVLGVLLLLVPAGSSKTTAAVQAPQAVKQPAATAPAAAPQPGTKVEAGKPPPPVSQPEGGGNAGCSCDVGGCPSCAAPVALSLALLAGMWFGRRR